MDKMNLLKKEENRLEECAYDTNGGNAMPVFHYGFDNVAMTHIQIEGNTLRCAATKITGVTFVGYPVLQIEDLYLEDCVFENCRIVNFTDCKVDRCRFDGVETVYADASPLAGCDFENLRCSDDCVLSLSDSDVSFCNFKNVELVNEAYLVNGTGDVWIKSCSFENVSTDRKDRDLFFCEETVGKIFKKKVQFCIADLDSCKGLEQVVCTAGARIPEDPEAELWLQVAQRGVRIDKAMEAMREGISWDESQWDAQTLGRCLGELIVPVKVYNCLTRAGLRTVGDLVRLDFSQIIRIRYLGKMVVTEVVNMLHGLNITGSAWDYFI